MFRTFVFAALGALLAACTPMQWYKPGVDDTMQARDLDGCRRQAREQSYYEINARLLSPPYGMGIDSRGYSTLAPPLAAEGDRVMIEDGLMQSCMRGLGYDLAPRSGNHAR